MRILQNLSVAAAALTAPACGALSQKTMPDLGTEVRGVIENGRADMLQIGFMKAAAEKALGGEVPKGVDPRLPMQLARNHFGACVYIPGVKSPQNAEEPLNPKELTHLNKARDVVRMTAAQDECSVRTALAEEGSKATWSETQDSIKRRVCNSFPKHWECADYYKVQRCGGQGYYGTDKCAGQLQLAVDCSNNPGFAECTKELPQICKSYPTFDSCRYIRAKDENNEGSSAQSDQFLTPGAKPLGGTITQASAYTSVANTNTTENGHCENMPTVIDKTIWVFGDIGKEYPVAAVCATGHTYNQTGGLHEHDNPGVYMINLAQGDTVVRIADQAVLTLAGEGARTSYEDENGTKIQRLDFGGGAESLQEVLDTPKVRSVNPYTEPVLSMYMIDDMTLDAWNHTVPPALTRDGSLCSPQNNSRTLISTERGGYKPSEVGEVEKQLLRHRVIGGMLCLKAAGDFAGNIFLDGTETEAEREQVEGCFTAVDARTGEIAAQCNDKIDGINKARQVGKFGAYVPSMPKLPNLEIR